MTKYRAGKFCMALGAALVIAALSLFLWNQYDDWRAGQSADSIMLLIKEAIDTVPKDQIINSHDNKMTAVEIDGYAYIGYITIPSLDRELPVIDGWDYARLKIAPCRYTGSVSSKDLVIAAHNYKAHFGTIGSLRPGDPIYFTDMNGKVSQYEVVEVDTLSPVAVEEMTNGEYELTLFTCTYGGQNRITVRCIQF